MSIVAGVSAQLKGQVAARHLEALGADEAVAQNPNIPEHLRGLPGVPFARKYRQVGRAYQTGRAYRPNMGLDPDVFEA